MKQCEFCKKEFMPKKAIARFCSTACSDKHRYHNDPKRKEATKERAKNWNAANKEHKKELDAAYYAANKEKHAESNKAWRQNNKERNKELKENWKQKNPVGYAIGKRREYSNKKAKKVGAAGKLNSKDLLEAINQHGWHCDYCGKDLDHKSITIDHKIPFSRGGLNTIENVTPACGTCNRRKASKTADEFKGDQLRIDPVTGNIF